MKISPKLLRPWLAGVAVVVLAGCSGGPLTLTPEEARDRLDEGVDLLSIFDYTAALHVLQPVPAAFEEGSTDWTKATFALASANRYLTPATETVINDSERLFSEVVETGNDPNLRALSLLELAREKELENYPGEEIDIEAAREQYRQVMEEYEDQVFAEEAAIRLANTYFTDVENPNAAGEGLKVLRQYLAEHPGGEMAVVMWQQIGNAEFRLRNDPAAALTGLEEARKLGFAEPTKKDNALWKMSQLAERSGQLQVAADLYRRILVEEPRAHEGTLARRRLVELKELHPEWNIEVPERLFFLEGDGPPAEPEPEATPEATPESAAPGDAPESAPPATEETST